MIEKNENKTLHWYTESKHFDWMFQITCLGSYDQLELFAEIVYEIGCKSKNYEWHSVMPTILFQLTTGPIPEDEPESGGLSGGAIAGIVIGCLLMVLLTAVVGYMFQKKKNGSKK